MEKTSNKKVGTLREIPTYLRTFLHVFTQNIHGFDHGSPKTSKF